MAHQDGPEGGRHASFHIVPGGVELVYKVMEVGDALDVLQAVAVRMIVPQIFADSPVCSVSLSLYAFIQGRCNFL